MGDRYVKSDEIKKTIHIDATNFYIWAMIESLPLDESKIDKNVNLEDTLNTLDDAKIGFFV